MHLKHHTLRAGCVAAVAALVTAFAPLPGASAMEPYKFNPATDIAPPDGPPGPDFPMKQNAVCATSAQLKGSQFATIPINSAWNLDQVQALATGRGQTVAVIDSGVNRNNRLPRLAGGGDYIAGRDGLQDCDHHGTLVAGIIGAQPSPADGFVGVAPGSSLISIRQTSGAYIVDSARTGNSREAQASSTISTLARAIVHAAALNASVINISVTACVPVTRPVDVRALAGALHYAAVVKNAVVVTAAGNLGGDCSTNPEPDPATPQDSRGWSNVSTISLPSMFDQFVLSVGGTNLSGDPYVMSLPGPWIGVAAPAINVVSLDPAKVSGELINAQQSKNGIEPIAGTSFAAAYVSGLAALVRERHPGLSAYQVRERIKRTAHAPSQSLSTLVGSGVVDPMAALTAPLDPSIPSLPPEVSSQAAVPGAPPPAADTVGRTVAAIAIGSLGAILFIVLLFAAVSAGRRKGNDI